MLKWIVGLAIALFTERAMAEPTKWEPLLGMTSAQLSASGWEMDGSAGLSWDDGRQAVISFWSMRMPNNTMPNNTKLTMRCTSYFDASMRQTGDICYQAISQR